jgi:hypothetical protein
MRALSRTSLYYQAGQAEDPLLLPRLLIPAGV